MSFALVLLLGMGQIPETQNPAESIEVIVVNGEELPAQRPRHFRPWKDSWDPNDWAKVPVSRPLPKFEYYSPMPIGEGYYSLWDRIQGLSRQTPPKIPFPRIPPMLMSFFESNWGYLEGEVPDIEKDWFDRLKRIHPNDNWTMTFGGEVRFRGENVVSQFYREFNENYWLNRERLYGDFWYRDAVRGYIEFISAEKHGQNDPTVFTDVNKADLLNAFFDFRIDQGYDEDRAYFRIGRQELNFGSQRLISTLDWANTRRTFQGVKILKRTEQYDVDLFWVQPVQINTGQFDSVNPAVSFAGWWNTWRPDPAVSGDFYLLNQNDNNKRLWGRTVFGVGAICPPLAFGPSGIKTVGLPKRKGCFNWASGPIRTSLPKPPVPAEVTHGKRSTAFPAFSFTMILLPVPKLRLPAVPTPPSNSSTLLGTTIWAIWI